MTEPGDRLDDLFRRYREACPAPDASADFMPGLWRKIDARRSFSWKLRVYARGLVTAAAALCLAMAAFELAPSAAANPVYTETYLEALDNFNPPETFAYVSLDTDTRPEPGQLSPQDH